MNRRSAFKLILGTAFIPRAHAADRSRVIGYLSLDRQRPAEITRLADFGWIEGKNLRVDLRTATLEPASYGTVVSELARSNVDVLVAVLPPWVVALASATRSIPIVCGVPDPIGLGVARSLARPGGNVTGLSGGLPERSEMTIGILKALRPPLRRIVSFHPPGAPAAMVNRVLAAAASAAGVALDFAFVKDVADVARFFGRVGEPASLAVIIGGPSHPPDVSSAILEAARGHRIAAVGGASAGALMDFGLRHADEEGRLAAILDKVLRGADPASIPFELPDRTVFVLNRTTARLIGVRIPPEVLLRASRLID